MVKNAKAFGLSRTVNPNLRVQNALMNKAQVHLRPVIKKAVRESIGNGDLVGFSPHDISQLQREKHDKLLTAWHIYRKQPNPSIGRKMFFENLGADAAQILAFSMEEARKGSPQITPLLREFLIKMSAPE